MVVRRRQRRRLSGALHLLCREACTHACAVCGWMRDGCKSVSGRATKGNSEEGGLGAPWRGRLASLRVDAPASGKTKKPIEAGGRSTAPPLLGFGSSACAGGQPEHAPYERPTPDHAGAGGCFGCAPTTWRRPYSLTLALLVSGGALRGGKAPRGDWAGPPSKAHSYQMGVPAGFRRRRPREEGR